MLEQVKTPIAVKQYMAKIGSKGGKRASTESKRLAGIKGAAVRWADKQKDSTPA